MSEKNIGLFPVNYLIGTELPGAPTLRLSLLVNTPDKRVNGWGRITQAVNPPVDIRTHAHGTYTYMATMKDNHILVVASGTPAADGPPQAGVALLLNFELRMVLADDWASGTAVYRYRIDGAWSPEVTAPVKLIASEPVQAAA